MELTIMQADKNFKSNRLQRIFERSKSISKNFVRHKNNGNEQILDKCEELSVRFFMRKELQGSNSKDFWNNGEYFEASCNNKSDEE
jgi:hypothetical protein